MNPNLKKAQIRALIERLQFRLKDTAKVPLKQQSDLNKPATQSASTHFKQGGSLPSVIENKENKTRVKFAPEEEEDDGFGSDFDADELLNLNDYNNKRKNAPKSQASQPAKKTFVSTKAVAKQEVKGKN